MMYTSQITLFAALLIVLSPCLTANAQITTPCTSSMILSFTPCIGFVTGSGSGSGSPTKACCKSLENLVANSMDCTCLIITGNVPISIPFINQNMAISLPRACQTSLPMQCKASGVPLPAPGPVLFSPPPAVLAPIGRAPTAVAPAPHRSHSPKASKAVAVPAPEPADPSMDFSPDASPPEFPLGPSAHPGVRPVVQPNAASNLFKYKELAFSFVVMIIGVIFSIYL